ncbi:TPA: hypothetical protein L4T72_004785, partial [Escherichia coli]|nr:hypothetical protein [Escherichia coli]
MNLFNPDRLITFPADDPQLVKQLQSGTKVYICSAGGRLRCAGGHERRAALGYDFVVLCDVVTALF